LVDLVAAQAHRDECIKSLAEAEEKVEKCKELKIKDKENKDKKLKI